MVRGESGLGYAKLSFVICLFKVTKNDQVTKPRALCAELHAGQRGGAGGEAEWSRGGKTNKQTNKRTNK